MHSTERLRGIAAWGALLTGLGFFASCKRVEVPLLQTRLNAPAVTGVGVRASTLGKGAAAPAPGASRRRFGDVGLGSVGANHEVGQPVTVGNLAVFPIYAKRQLELGRFTTLSAALQAGTAEVREVRLKASASRQAVRRAPPRRIPPAGQNAHRGGLPLTVINKDSSGDVNVSVSGGGAQVNRLVIDNRGDVPILVLAGTVVKGGKQDRQIAQDFVVGPKKRVAVDAFCVERGRWNGNRAGKATGGRFTTVDSLANLDVRNAAQHDSSQSLVWQNVAETNKDNNVRSGSGTLMATLDNVELRRRRQKLLAQLTAGLGRMPHPRRIVGLAYAVEGRVRSVRWFFNRAVFLKFQKVLLTTAALEGLTARARARRRGAPAGRPVVAAVGDVTAFIRSFAQPTRRKRRATDGLNDNYYRGNARGNQSITVLRSEGADNPVSVDFSAK